MLFSKTYHRAKEFFKIFTPNKVDLDWYPITATDLGFATDGDEKHLLIDVPNYERTISLRTSNGGMLTIRLNVDLPGEAPVSVDIVSHRQQREYNNGPSGGYKPTLDALLWSRGQVIGQGSKIHETPCDRITVLL